MSIRPWTEPSLKTDAEKTRLPGVLVAALACQFWGCASATVSEIHRADGGTTDDGPQADGKDTSAPNTKKDGAIQDGYSGVCDPFSNNGCDSDKKCTALQQSDKTLSLGCGTKGSHNEGDSCAQTAPSGTQTGDDCGDGLACFSVGGTSSCHRICPTSGTANACPSSSVCSLAVSGLTGLAFCQASCKPLEQTGCQSDKNEGCYSIDIGAVCLPRRGDKAPGETCSLPNDCAPGSTCINGATSICSSYCSTATNGTPSCSDGKTCKKLPGTAPEPNAGYCG